MQVFAVIAPGANELLDRAVKTQFAGNFLEIAPGQYLVATRGLIAQEVVDKLGDHGKSGRFFVVPFQGYNGWHKNQIFGNGRSLGRRYESAYRAGLGAAD